MRSKKNKFCKVEKNLFFMAKSSLPWLNQWDWTPKISKIVENCKFYDTLKNSKIDYFGDILLKIQFLSKSTVFNIYLF